MTAAPGTGAAKYRPDIDGLRAVAVLAVVFYHAGLGVPGGYLGVDIFFVISGYLIVKIIYDPMVEGRFSPADFYVRRIRRLFPAMFVMLLATSLWAMWNLIAPDLEDFGTSLIAALAYVPNVYFYYVNSSYFAEAAITKPLLHTWSLGVEEQFYLAAPLLLWALVRLAPRRAHVPAIALLILASFCLSALQPPAVSLGGFYLLPARAWELGLGGALALAALPVGRHRGLAEALSLGGLIAIGLALATAGESAGLSIWQAALAAGGAAAILASGAGPGGLVHKLLAFPLATFIGKISYSLYLWHWPVFVALSYGSGTALSLEWALLGVAISLALAAASWRWVEQPVRSGRRLARKRALLAACALATGAGLATGAVLLATNGLPARHPELATLLDESRLRTPRRECHRATAPRADADDLCLRGAPNQPPSFVLVGDSHANTLSHGLFEAAAARGVAGTQFTAAGFIPLPGWEAPGPDSPLHLMPVFERYLRRHPEIRTIIVAGFWSYAATGWQYRFGQTIRMDGDRSASDGAAANRGDSLRRGLERLVRLFPDRQFIFVDDVPTGDALSPKHNARHIFTRGIWLDGLPRAAADAQRSTYEPILQAVQAGNPNALYVPALAALCAGDRCPASDGAGRPLYRDGDHLSPHGSGQMAPRLERLFSGPPKPTNKPE